MNPEERVYKCDKPGCFTEDIYAAMFPDPNPESAKVFCGAHITDPELWKPRVEGKMIREFESLPVTLRGIVWDGTNFYEIQQFTNGLARMSNNHLHIETTEGSSRAQIGDTILEGTEGEFYPVKPRVMANKYREKKNEV